MTARQQAESESTTAVGQARWLGQAWNATLDTSRPVHARGVARGEAALRRGAVQQLEIGAGGVTARVLDERDGDVEVRIGIEVFDVDAWDVVTAGLAERLRFTAALLQGALPRELAVGLEKAGTPLLPARDELTAVCGVHGHDVCPHVVAVHRATGLRLDRTPTELLTMRGKAPNEVLHDVRAVRGDEVDDVGEIAVPSDEQLAVARGDLDAIVVHPASSSDPGWLLRHLGEPPGVDDVEPMIELIERAADGAWRLAAGDGAEHADVEVLMGELRSRRMATASVLAEALGRDVDAVQLELDELYEAGTVLRTGSGDGAKFRAVDA